MFARMSSNKYAFARLAACPARLRERQPLSRQSLVLLATCVAVFVAQLDTSVVNLALKQVGGDLNAGLNGLQWVLDAYNLAYASFLLTGGTLGDAYGRRTIFLTGLGLFTGGSLICGLAPDETTLIAGRGLTGLGAAFAVPVSLAILSETFTGTAERTRAIGIWASCNALAWLVGPAAGGFAVGYAGWRSLFILVVPVGIAGFLLARRCIPQSRANGGRVLDLPGQALAIVALGAFALGGIEGPHWGWGSPWTLSSLLIAAMAFAGFVVVELRSRAPLLSLAIFRAVPFSAATAVAATMTFGMYGMLFLVPLYLQSARGATAVVAGLELLPMALVFALLSQKSGKLAVRFGARAMMAAGTACMGFGLAMLAMVSVQTSIVVVMLALVVIGVGLGLNTGPTLSVAVETLPKALAGTAAGVVNTSRMTGATLGVALLGSLFAAYAGPMPESPQALVEGMRLALIVGAFVEFAGTVVAVLFIPRLALVKASR